METRGIRRLVAVTGIGAGDTRGKGGFLYDWIVFPLLLGGIYADKNREEKLIRASNLDWTIVRPGFLTNGPPKGVVTALTQRKDYRAGRISRADVASFICDAIEHGEHVGEAPLIIA
jgi:putative NADH-flavin reductase